MLKVPVSEKDHFQGSFEAPITLVEYGDYECPYCAKANFIVTQVLEHFGEGICYVFRHFPLTQIRPQAELAAETAEFAASHEYFWEMHNLLFKNQNRLSPEVMFELVATLELPGSKYEGDMRNNVYLPRIKEMFMGGVRSGVNSTPTFFINGARYNESYDYEELVKALEKSS